MTRGRPAIARAATLPTCAQEGWVGFVLSVFWLPSRGVRARVPSTLISLRAWSLPVAALVHPHAGSSRATGLPRTTARTRARTRTRTQARARTRARARAQSRAQSRTQAQSRAQARAHAGAVVNDWACLEWLFDGTSDDAGEPAEPRMWLNGSELSWPTTFIYPANASAPTRQPVTNFIDLETGIYMYQGLTTVTNWWVDDLAVGPQRIGLQLRPSATSRPHDRAVLFEPRRARGPRANRARRRSR
jgi:hypothetical protein